MTSRTLLFSSLAALAGPALAQAPAPAEPPKAIDWKDLTKSGIPIRFYGFFRLDAYYNTARMDSVVVPGRVLSEAAKHNDNQFFLDPRLTRFGIDITPVATVAGTVTGKLEIDFANFPTGSAESRATPRIRLAYLDVARDDLGLRVGQDWDVISPLYPAVNHELLMWNAGNLGDRRAQIQGRYAPKDSAVDVKACLGLTGAVNNQDIDGNGTGERDGFDSGMPHVQLRVGLETDSPAEKKKIELGGWGMYGRTETDTRYAGENRFDVWVAGVDFSVPVCESLTVRGEAWTGTNLGDVRGGIGQTINITAASPGFGSEISSSGGFAELVFAATPKTKFHAGASLDDPDNEDLAAGNPSRNLTNYVGTTVDWDTGVRTGFDVIYWETDYAGTPGGTAVRFDLYFQYNF